jgi:hypothetical protein
MAASVIACSQILAGGIATIGIAATDSKDPCEASGLDVGDIRLPLAPRKAESLSAWA